MKNIVLIGFMGTGKSSTGWLLSQRLGRPFIDTDKKIEIDNNMTISDMFSQYGEAYFRQKEREVITKVSRYTSAVISTGGGVVVSRENVARLKGSGVLILLEADIEVILERTDRRGSIRPLLECQEREQRVIKLLAERVELYQAAADYRLDTSQQSPQEVADMIIQLLRQGGYLRGRG